MTAVKGDVVVAPVWRKARSHETMAAWPRMYRILAACGSGPLPGFTFPSTSLTLL